MEFGFQVLRMSRLGSLFSLLILRYRSRRDGFGALDGISRRAREGELAQDADGARRTE